MCKCASTIQLVENMQGTIEGHEEEYALDQDHKFTTGKPALVCGNTAAMLGEGSLSWLAQHFQVSLYCSQFQSNFVFAQNPNPNPQSLAACPLGKASKAQELIPQLYALKAPGL